MTYEQVVPEVSEPPRPLRVYLGTMAFVLLCGAVGPVFLVVGLATDGVPETGWLLPTGIAVTVLVLVVGFFTAQGMVRSQRRRYFLETQGVRGRAIVLRADTTNTEINDKPVIKLRLRIELPDRPAFVEDVSEAVPPLGIAQISRGRVAILADPDPEGQTWEFDWRPGAFDDTETPGGYGAGRSLAERLADLDALLRQDLIGRDEYDAQRHRILGQI